MADEHFDYLEPGFDPRSCTIPRLRSILVTHQVDYSGGAKKQDLVELFNQYIVPQAAKIKARQLKAKRSSMGIVDAEPMQSTSMEEMDDYDNARRRTRSRSPRKAPSRRNIKDEHYDDDLDLVPTVEQPPPVSPRRRNVRSVSRQAPSDNEMEPDYGRRSVRQSSRRSATPAVKLEPPSEARNNLFASPRRSTFARQVSEDEEEEDEDEQREELPPPQPEPVRDEGPFSSDNPFQSGSSPAVKTPSNRRRTTGGPDMFGKSASVARRRTDVPICTEAQTPRNVSRKFEVPSTLKAAAPKTPKTPENFAAMEPGEEFTPDAQLELTQEEAAGHVVAWRQQHDNRQKSGSLITPLWVILIVLLGVYGAWYRQEKIRVGYCDMGQPPRSLVGPEVQALLPPWAQVLVEPKCENCPKYAYCHEDFSVNCADDYIMKPHPLSVFGLVPLPPTCEPDGEKVRRVKAVADKAVEELRERRAQFECGELKDEDGKQVETAAVEEDVLKQIIGDKRSKKMGKQEFDDLWAVALGDIKDRDEIEVEEDIVQTRDSGAVPHTRLSSTSLARLPLTCSVRRTFRLGLERHRLGLSAVVAAVLLAIYLRWYYMRHVATAAQVPALVDTVLSRLAAQKELAYETDGQADDPFLFLPNLRDDVLRSVHSLRERDRIWGSVRAVVEQNSNVRQGQRQGHDGEYGLAWEWIGTAGVGAGRRRTLGGRMSLGARGDEVEDDADRSGIHQKWNEGGGRPAF